MSKFITKAELTAMKSTGVVNLGDDMDSPQLKVRGMTGSERDELGAAASEGINDTFLTVRRSLINRCILDADGNRMFADGESPDLDGIVYSKCWDEIGRLSGFDETAEDDISGN